ncbi:O-fucosyltransferase family protein [Acetobacter persici]|uniref:O-fucosyltransferase family protein n=1 Tax=Acetobacter persici TaxID=1076596 RepID=UPI0020CCD678|nr:O-fucosyltransferase family protein [Acetobacter persici]MCP9319902.1 O-fucosyltransferase family protein [Acetobacter persici]
MAYISFNGSDAGLTNQKLALLGLAHRALREGRGIKLPPMVIFDPSQPIQGKRLPISYAFNISKLKSVLQAFGISVADDHIDSYEEVSESECFWEGANYFGKVRNEGDCALYKLTCQIIKSLELSEDFLSIVRPLSEHIFNKVGIKHVIQMRIENDWQAYSWGVLNSFSEEDNFPTPLKIISKIKAKFGESFSSALILCDEKNMSISKDEIKKIVNDTFGVQVVWKSDFINIENIDKLGLSLIDFSLASNADYFIGTSQSTFSCFVTFEKYCKTRSTVYNHYIYNGKSGGIDERFDNGTCTNSDLAIDQTYLRKPLFHRSKYDINLPLTIEAHVSNLGDYKTQNSLQSFPEGLDLVVGTASKENYHQIEGFSIHIPGNELKIQYKAFLGNGIETDWVENGDYCGTKGESNPILYFSIEIKESKKIDIDCFYAAVFSDSTDIITAKNGEICKSKTGKGSLLSFQLLFKKNTII